MTQKIIYFTQGSVVTEAENTEIDNLSDQFAKPVAEVFSRNSKADLTYGGTLEECDLVSGAVPPEYSAKPVVDGDTQSATVLDGQVTDVNDQATGVAAGSVVLLEGSLAQVLFTAGTDAIVTDQQTVTLDATTYTFTVADGKITAITVTPTGV